MQIISPPCAQLSVTAPPISAMPEVTAMKAVLLAKAEARLDEKIRRLAEAEQDALDVIRLVPLSESRSYLMMRFVKGMTPKEIGQEVHVGRATVFRMQRDALQAADCVLLQREHGGRADE